MNSEYESIAVKVTDRFVNFELFIPEMLKHKMDMVRERYNAVSIALYIRGKFCLYACTIAISITKSRSINVAIP